MDLLSLVARLGLDSSEYESGLKGAKSLASSVGGAIGNGFKTMAKTTVAAVGTATTAVTAFAGTSVKVGADFDKSMSQVAATMGKTMDDLKKEVGSVDTAWGTFDGNLREYAQFLGKNTAFSATQAADALNYMALAGYDTQKSMEMLPNVLNLASAGNMELARASDMVTDAQTAFGITTERTTQMVDEMAKAASTGNTSVEQLGDAFLVVGGLAQELNGGVVELANGTTQSVDGVQELEIALTAMANAGIKGGEAGTHMRNMLLKLSDPTDEGTIALQKMGVAIYDAEGNMNSLTDIMTDLNGELSTMSQEDKIKTISALFNTRDMASAESLLNAVTQQFVKMGDEVMSIDEAYKKYGDDIYDSSKGFELVQSDWNKIGESILKSKGAADEMAKTQLNNLAGDVTLFKSALEGAQIAISDTLTPSLREFVQFGTKGLSTLTDAFESGGITGAMEAFGTILSNGLDMIITKLPDAVDAGMKLLGALGQGILDNMPVIVDAAVKIVVQLANGLVSALPALVQGAKDLVTSLSTSFEQNKPALIAVGKQLLEMLINGLTEGVPELWTWGTELIANMVNFFSENAAEIASVGAEIILSIANGIAENIPSLLESLANVVITIATALTNPDTLTPLLEGAVNIIMALANGLLIALPKLIEAAPVIIQNLVQALVSNLPMIIDTAIQLIGALAQAFLENLPLIIAAAIQIVFALVSGLLEALPDLLLAGVHLIVELIATVIEMLPEIIDGGIKIVGAIIEGIASMIGAFGKAAIGLLEELFKVFAGSAAKLIQAGKTLVDKVGSGIKDKVEAAKQWGMDLINNFINGLKAKWDALKQTVSDIAGSIKSLLGFSEPEEGPLSNFHTYAPDMMDLFMKGIDDNKDKLTDTVKSAFDFKDLIEGPEITSAGGFSSGVSKDSQGIGNNYYTININQPIATPSELASQIRLESQYGLIHGEVLE